MGQRTGHISVGVGGRGGPENDPQRVYRGKHGGPVHHMMVGPQHVTRDMRGTMGETAGPVAYMGCGWIGRNADGEEKETRSVSAKRILSEGVRWKRG